MRHHGIINQIVMTFFQFSCLWGGHKKTVTLPGSHKNGFWVRPQCNTYSPFRAFGLFQTKSLFYFLNIIEFFPCKELHLFFDRRKIRR